MKRGHAAWMLTCLLVICGCPGAKPAADVGGADFDQPKAANDSAGQAISKIQTSDSGTTGDSQDNSGGKAISPAEGEALSVLSKDHYLAVMVNVEKIRGNPLVKKPPGDFDEMLVQLVQEQSPLDISEQVDDLEMLLAAASPGTGRFEDFMLHSDDIVFDAAVAAADDQSGPGLTAPGDIPEPPLHAIIYARFNTEQAVDELRATYAPQDGPRPVKYGGSEYFRASEAPIWYLFGKRHVIIASREELLKGAIDHAGVPVDGPLVERLQAMNLDADFVAAGMLGPVRDSLETLLAQSDGVPPQVTIAVKKLNAFSLAIDLEAKEIINLNTQAVDEDGAEMLVDTVRGLLALGNFGLAAQMNRAREPGAPPEALDFMRFAQRTLGQVLVQRDGVRLDVSLARPRDLDEVVAKAAVVADASAKRAVRMNNGHMLGIGAHRRFADNGKTLENKQDAEGKLVESWRAQVLPYVADVGPADEMPKIFQSELAPAPGTTTWKLVAAIKRIDGLHARIMFLETGKGTAVPWRQPEEFRFDPDDPRTALGEEPEGGYVAVFADGHVEMLDTAELVKLLTAQVSADARE